MTITQMAGYFEVSVKTIKRQYETDKAEFDEDGVRILPLSAFKNLNSGMCPIKNIKQERGYMAITLNENTEIIIPNRGIRCFPKRAIVRMSMRLQNSRVCKEMRTQHETLTSEQLTKPIDKEQLLIENFAKALRDGNSEDALKAAHELFEYKKRGKVDPEE